MNEIADDAASCSRWDVLVASRLKVAADGVELLGGEDRFDPPEDRSLFVANVLTEQLAELVEDFGCGVGRALELGDSATEVGVLGQDALDASVICTGVSPRPGGAVPLRGQRPRSMRAWP